jgi:hypothetical protein
MGNGVSPDRRPIRISALAGCLLGGLAGLSGVCAVWLTLNLAARGEIRVARQQLTEARLWLIGDIESSGLGLSWARALPVSDDGRRCVVRRTAFWLWRGAADPAPAYCECYRRAPEGWMYDGACPTP